jgi:site-specific DNA-methyltransferase (adenine-specific)
MMDDKGFALLLHDIDRNGQEEPIAICDGMILDGRNRYRACIELGLKPVTQEYNGNPWDYTWTMNGARRDMDATVKALIHMECQKQSDKWAKKHGEIKAAGNAKRAAAAKEGRVGRASAKAKASLVADHDEPRQKGGKHRAREARAAGAKVSPATMGRAEQIAKHPDLAKKVVALEIKPAAALSEIRKRKRRAAMTEASQKAVEARGESHQPLHSLLKMDVIQGLESVRDHHDPVRLIFTDPPYNIGIDYGGGKKGDLLTSDQYLKWVESWIGLCCECLADDGSLWVMINDEYAAEYAMILKKQKLNVRSWIKWYETFGVNCSANFNRTSRHIFYTVKNPKSFVFNPEAVTRASDRQTKYGDSRAAEGGKIWDDVWQIPRLTGTCKERVPDFPTQLPLALVEPIVLCASMPGDLVVDPFNGSGTTGVAAVRNGRKYVGIDKSEKFIDIATERLNAI